MTKKKAYGRVGLLGNPSDIYGGKCISFCIDRCAEVEVKDSDFLRIVGNGGIENNLNYNGHSDLIKATIRKLKLENEKLEIKYDSDIPFGSGLAGSSAIVIALIRGLNEKYDLKMNKYEIAEVALKVETEELGISAGYQDRYAISFEGVNYMDFSGKEYMRDSDNYGLIDLINIKEVPFFLALGVKPKSSAVVHNPLRKRFLAGGLEAIRIKEGMDKIADLAFEGRNYLYEGDWKKLGGLMDKNTELREEFCPHEKMDKKMMERARKVGALGAKVAGSGGAIVVLYENESTLEEMIVNYPCLKPKIV